MRHSAKAEIDSIVSEYVPDKRMGICEMSLTKGDRNSAILKGETTSIEAKEAIIKTLNKHTKVLIDSVIILPDTVHNKQFMGLVTLSVINLRKIPAESAELVSQALLGTPVKIIKIQNSWFLVQTPDNYLGWAEESSVVPVSVTDLNIWKRSDRVITIANSGWIYSSPGGTDVVGDYVSGCIMVREGEEKGFLKIRLPDGRTGYLDRRTAADFNIWKDSVECTGGSILRCASSFKGLPYLWGGTSGKGFDCSGFSKTVYFLNGLILCRDASQQALHGKNIDLSSGWEQLRPGDLLFFGTMKGTTPHVVHVGIYIGDSEFIHSTSAGPLKVSSLDSTRINFSGYPKDFLLSAKRVIGVEHDPGIVHIDSHPWY